MYNLSLLVTILKNISRTATGECYYKKTIYTNKKNAAIDNFFFDCVLHVHVQFQRSQATCTKNFWQQFFTEISLASLFLALCNEVRLFFTTILIRTRLPRNTFAPSHNAFLFFLTLAAQLECTRSLVLLITYFSLLFSSS